MKTSILFAAALVCAAPVWAQPDPIAKPINGLPFPVVALAEAEKLAIPMPIRLHLQDVTLGAALDELQKQSGVTLDGLDGAPKETLAKTLTLDFETPSFNRAFAEIMDEAGAKAMLQRWDWNQPWRVAFDQTDDMKDAARSVAGLFVTRLDSTSVTLSKTAQLGDIRAPVRTQQHTLGVNLKLLPALNLPTLGKPRARITRAEDEQGRSLIAPPDPNDYSNNTYSFYESWGRDQYQVRLLAPAPDAHKLAHLEGALIYALVTQTETWEIPDLMSAPQWTRQFAGENAKFDVTLKPVAKDESLALSVEVASGQRLDYQQIAEPLLSYSTILEALQIRDANGALLRNTESRSYFDNDNGKLTLNANFYPPNPNGNPNGNPNEGNVKLALPLHFAFKAPVGVVQTEVPFSFEDVPLP